MGLWNVILLSFPKLDFDVSILLTECTHQKRNVLFLQHRSTYMNYSQVWGSVLTCWGFFQAFNLFRGMVGRGLSWPFWSEHWFFLTVLWRRGAKGLLMREQLFWSGTSILPPERYKAWPSSGWQFKVLCFYYATPAVAFVTSVEIPKEPSF